MSDGKKGTYVTQILLSVWKNCNHVHIRREPVLFNIASLELSVPSLLSVSMDKYHSPGLQSYKCYSSAQITRRRVDCFKNTDNWQFCAYLQQYLCLLFFISTLCSQNHLEFILVSYVICFLIPNLAAVYSFVIHTHAH